MSDRLVACRACGKMVSKDAAKCPHCGDPNQVFDPPRPAFLLIVLGLAAAVLGAWWYVGR